MTISRTFRLASTMQTHTDVLFLPLVFTQSIPGMPLHSAAGRLGHGIETPCFMGNPVCHSYQLGPHNPSPRVSVSVSYISHKRYEVFVEVFIHHPLQYVSGSQWPGNSCSKGSTKPLSHYVLIACLLTKP